MTHKQDMDKYLALMDKGYGAGRFIRAAKPVPYEVISTGSLEFDIKTNVGGWVVGRISEIWGAEGSGKTSLAMIAAANAQAAYPDRDVLFIDMEQRLDLQWAISHGVDLERMVIVRPRNAEEVADILKDSCRSKLFSFIVVDSIGAMIPEVERQKMADEAVVAAQAKIVTRMVKINAYEAREANTAVLLINQVRANIGSYGGGVTTSGGFALKHATTMKVQIRRSSDGAIFVGKGNSRQQVGHMITANIERSSVALAYKRAEFGFLYVTTPEYGKMGVDRAMEAANLAISHGVVEQAGAWYTNKITGERVQGKGAVIKQFRDNPEMVSEVRERVLQAVRVDQIGDIERDETIAFDVEGGSDE